MEPDIQVLVDDLAVQLGRSVAVDDHELQPVVVSPHYGAIDDARLEAILSKRTSEHITAFARRFLRPHRGEPVRVPANDDYRTLPRIVFSLRFEGEHYGYLWLIDADPPLRPAEVETARSVGDAVAEVWAHSTIASDERLAEDRSTVGALLSADPAVARAALARCREDPRLGLDERVAVATLRVRPSRPEAERAGAPPEADLAARAARAVHALGAVLVAAWEDQLIVIGGGTALEVNDQGRGTTPQSQALWQRLLSAVHRRGLEVVAVGVALGGDGVSLATTFERARYAAFAAGDERPSPAVLSWEHLGPRQLLFGLTFSWSAAEQLLPGVGELCRHRELAVTLATFLNCGGDVAATVSALRVHRTSFYYRRDRIVELIGDAWMTGPARGAAQVALALVAQLAPELRALESAPS